MELPVVSKILCLFSGVFFMSYAEAQDIEPVDGKMTPVFTDYTTSWIANDGGCEELHIPHDMLNMYVRPDGVVATICEWDEGGTNVGVFKDGKLISRPEGSGTGGWGRFSGKAVVLDDRYVYQLLTQNGCDGANSEMNRNGLPQFPACNDTDEWKTVRRYFYENGKGAPFPGGYGYKGDMLVVCTGRLRELAGLAITEHELFVAVTGLPDTSMPDSIKVYDKKNMSFVRGFHVDGGLGNLYADNRGGIWMLQGNKIIRFRQDNGGRLPQVVAIPEGVRVSSFSVDIYKDRLLIPDYGRNLNILLYTNIYDHPVQKSTFGVKGGVLSRSGDFLQGEAGPMRFCGPRGAGVDRAGNLYVANTFVAGGRGAVLEAYNEKRKKILWKQEGLVFTATADFDRSYPACYYTPEKIHRIDPGKSGYRIDELQAYTADPFLFPDDERCKEKGPFVTSCFKRAILGESFLFVSDMYGGMLAGYRFDKKNNGYIGIPFLTAGNGDPDKKRPLKFWVDHNGDGIEQAGENAGQDEINQYSMSFFVDKTGNIWRGVRGQGFMLWKVTGINEKGIPRYASARLFPLPAGFSDAKRIFYDPEKDELFLAGSSPLHPDKRDTWWAMGSTIAVCRNFMQRTDGGTVAPAGWVSDLMLYIPFSTEDGSGKDVWNAKAFTVEGDYIFIALAREGYITVYDRASGKFTGRLCPGKEVSCQSGWCDFNYAVNARKNKDGSYEILAEENAFAKVIRYHLKTMNTHIPE